MLLWSATGKVSLHPESISVPRDVVRPSSFRTSLRGAVASHVAAFRTWNARGIRAAQPRVRKLLPANHILYFYLVGVSPSLLRMLNSAQSSTFGPRNGRSYPIG